MTLNDKNRRNFLKAAGLTMAAPLVQSIGQSNGQNRSANGAATQTAASSDSSIKLIKATPYVIRTKPPHWGGGYWYFVRLETNTGLVGWGETAILGALNGLQKSYQSLIREAFSYYLEGKNPIDRERVLRANCKPKC